MKYWNLLEKSGAKTGDKVRVETTKGDYSGTLLPSSNFLEIKLANGYNVGFMPESVKNLKVIEKPKIKAKKNSDKISVNAFLPLVTILHTGGTIASKVDYSNGGVSPSIDSEEIISAIPEISRMVNIKSVFVTNVLSEEISFQHYKEFARAVKSAIQEKPKGIVVTHGTDTMHYSASALSFIFENLPIPIIFVGSQRSSDRPSTDAKLNLINAVRFITKTDFAGVAICMHAGLSDDSCYILPATKSRKMHSTRRDAFRAINSKPIAKVSDNGIEYLQNYERYEGGQLNVNDNFEEKVAIIKARPGLRSEEIKFFEEKAYKGLIIEGTGMGHIAISEGKNTENFEAIKSLIGSGCIVCMTTQCIFGRTNPNVYSTGRRLKEAGVLFLEDMTTETAYIKLSWLLGNFGTEKAKELMQKNLRGELSERIGTEFI
ncbi:MAG: Glu-tRNA(Gln) amidotransferase subunit GatD [Candidatus Diapherotrites archaeon]|nr:Glu-tRNA(Gln) amidotransferase subunit GatD [Candidatus Diapherotrites archaeon]